MDGLDLCEELRARQETRAAASGMDGYLTKPPNTETFVEPVQGFVATAAG